MVSPVIKNLWLISPVGICYFHYQATFSDYQIDATLFSGLVAGLSNFADSLSAERKSLDYLKLGNDELYLETVGDVIVATILASGSGEKLSAFAVKLMLQLIGQKFLEDYQDKTAELAYNWEEIQHPFSKEIGSFIHDEALMEDLRIHQFQNLFDEAISNNLPVDMLYWNGIQLFQSNPHVSAEALEVITSLAEVTPSLISDALLEAKILEVLHRLSKDLKLSTDQEPRKLLILCDAVGTFAFLHQVFLPSGILSMHCSDFTQLQQIIGAWVDPNPFDILLVDTRVTTKEIRLLHSLSIDSEQTRILCICEKIPRPPRGRLARKHISFVVEKNLELTRENPLLDYLLSFFTLGI